MQTAQVICRYLNKLVRNPFRTAARAFAATRLVGLFSGKGQAIRWTAIQFFRRNIAAAMPLASNDAGPDERVIYPVRGTASLSRRAVRMTALCAEWLSKRTGDPFAK
jgi:hypothetical protein